MSTRPVASARDTRRGLSFTGRLITRGSLLQRFSLLSFVVLALIAAGLGWVVQRQMEHTALVQQADEVSVVVNGVFTRHLTPRDLANVDQPTERAQWQRLGETLLAADRHIVRIKVWDMQGRIVYSNNPY